MHEYTYIRAYMHTFIHAYSKPYIDYSLSTIYIQS